MKFYVTFNLFLHIGWDSGSVRCNFSSFRFGTGVLNHKGLLNRKKFTYFIFISWYNSATIIDFCYTNCGLTDFCVLSSSVLFELLQYLEAYFKFFFLYVYVELQPRYV